MDQFIFIQNKSCVDKHSINFTYLFSQVYYFITWNRKASRNKYSKLCWMDTQNLALGSLFVQNSDKKFFWNLVSSFHLGSLAQLRIFFLKFFCTFLVSKQFEAISLVINWPCLARLLPLQLLYVFLIFQKGWVLKLWNWLQDT